MNSPLASMSSGSRFGGPETSIRQVVELMAARTIGSMVVVDDRAAAGRHLHAVGRAQAHRLPGTSLDQPISSGDVACIRIHLAAGGERLRCGAGDGHARRSPRAGGGRGWALKGVISERDLFTLQGVGLRQIRHAIDAASSIEVLQQARGCPPAVAQRCSRRGRRRADHPVHFDAQRHRDAPHHRAQSRSARSLRHRLGVAVLRFGRARRTDLQHRSG
jgi:CBS domain-containing protein